MHNDDINQRLTIGMLRDMVALVAARELKTENRKNGFIDVGTLS